MTISTYAELVTAVGDWMHRPDLAAKTADFITLAENRLNNELRLSSMEVEANVAITLGSDSAVLPARFLEPIAFKDDVYQELVQVNPHTLYAYQSGSAGKPSHYAISAQIDFPDNSDANYTYVMRHYKRLDIAADSTSWLLTHSPDAYLYTALAMAGVYARDSALTTFAQMSADAIAAIKKSDFKIKSRPALRSELAGFGRSNILTDS